MLDNKTSIPLDGTGFNVSKKNGMLIKDGVVIPYIEKIMMHNYPVNYNVTLFMALALHKITITPTNVKYLNMLDAVKIGGIVSSTDSAKNLDDIKRMNFKMYFDKPIKYKTEKGDDYYISPMNISLAFNNEKVIDISNDNFIRIVKTAPYAYDVIQTHNGIYHYYILKAYALLQNPSKEEIKHKFVVDHIDRDRKNNDVSNFRFVTRSGNSQGTNYKDNNGMGIEIEVLNIETNVKTKYYSLKAFMRGTGVKVVDSSKVYGPLKHGAYEGKYVWVKNDEFPLTFEDVMDRYCYYKYEVYDENDSLIDIQYSTKDVVRKYLGDKASTEQNVLQTIRTLHNGTNGLKFKFNRGSEVVRLGGKNGITVSYEAYDPITKKKVIATTLRDLSKKLGDYPSHAIGQIKKGPYYVNSNGYIVREVGEYENKVLEYSPKLNVYEVYKDEELIDTVDSVRGIHAITKGSRGGIAYKIDLGKDFYHGGYSIVMKNYIDKLKKTNIDISNIK